MGKDFFKNKTMHSFKRKYEFVPTQVHHHHNNKNGHKAPRLIEGHNDAVKAKQIADQRKTLPIFSARKRFLEEISKHQTVILVGETGSGKTTQIPQFLHEQRLDKYGAIAVTQPRRMAAISISKRVAHEMQVTIGTMVGYKVRFEDVSDDRSKIIFLTDGMLLREAMLDPTLSKYNWIILDEAHERTVNTDILFGIVKVAQKSRNNPEKQNYHREKTLKVIVMSATLNAERLSDYFLQAPILHVIGRQFPVNIYHMKNTDEDWLNATLSTIFQIHQTAPERHDILVFLTGQEEIENMVKQVRSIAKEFDEDKLLEKKLPRVEAVALYASQNTGLQQKVFFATRPGWRKIILSTNIAETSLTIPGIKYVIDSCRVKAKVHQASIGLDMLKVVQISQAQALQRTGRSGREAEGHCYRMLTRAEFDRLPKESTPEILRCNLATVLLQMFAMGISSPEGFDFLERPPDDAIAGGVRILHLLGALEKSTQNEKSYKLTESGRKMAPFPLDPKFTKMIFVAKQLGCTEEILTIASMLSGESILITPSAKREEALAARKKFVSSEGDHVTYLKIFRAFNAAKEEKSRWCVQNYIHHRHITFASDIRKQLMDLCRKNGIPVQSCGQDTERVRKAIALGLFTNVARLTKEGHYVTLDSRQQVIIHPSSVLFQNKPELVVFTELISTQKSYIRDVSLIDGKWLLEAQPEYFRQHRLI